MSYRLAQQQVVIQVFHTLLFRKADFSHFLTVSKFKGILVFKLKLLHFLFQFVTITGSTLFRDMVDLPLLTEIGDRLDKDIPTIKNWRDLAYRLEISPETYELFDSSKAKAKSPTKMMFEYLAVCEPNLSVGDLLRGIKKIGRNDVVELVTKEAEKSECTYSLDPPRFTVATGSGQLQVR